MADVRKRVIVSGMVQGVFFRSYAVDNARNMGLTGWVKNRSDGKVEAVFEGEESAVDRMVQWCRKGPPSAHVKEVEIISEKYMGEFDTFSVEFW